MKLLLDTQILLWAVARTELLSEQARQLLTDDRALRPSARWSLATGRNCGR